MTKTFAMTAIAALLLATPVFAQTASGDAEVQSTIEWQNLVTKANADRIAASQNQGDVAAIKGTTATDATATHAAQQTTPNGRYNTMEDYWNDRS